MPEKTEGPGPGSDRVAGLDSIRFIAACWVMFFHLGFSNTFNVLERDNLVTRVLGAALDCVFCGPAAVIVFFVVSGFCIHFPFRNERKKLQPGTFLIRRYIRILIPLLACIVCLKFIGMTYDTVGRLVGWSIECELIYYTAYPLILILARRIGWTALILITFPLALILVLPRLPSAMMYPSFGMLWNAVLGLPCWLIGCKLAEGFKPDTLPPMRTKWIWRVLVLFCSSLVFSCMLHLKIGFPWTLNFFAIVTFFWLKNEIYTRKENCFPILEWAGKWSYSLYLMHGPLANVFNRMQLKTPHVIIEWTLRLMFVLIFSYLFYLAFEKTSHHLARSITKKKKTALS
jgi:peptidoglycan/LPS O-acetylase OafA/YrhL